MKTYVDTNILYYKYADKSYKQEIFGRNITSVNALEFVKNIEKKHHNKAKYYIPKLRPGFHGNLILQTGLLFKNKRPFPQNLSDSVLFDFKQDYDSYVFYNNESISETINQNLRHIFNLSLSFLNKKDYKEIKSKFDFLLTNKVICDSISPEDIELGYLLLEAFLLKYSIKGDFRNSWNDILILAKSINEGANLLTSDKLLNKFACEVYGGLVTRTADYMEIQFPKRSTQMICRKNEKFESKGYVNRGWEYKI